MILKPINLTIADVLDQNDKYLPLTAKDQARLVAHIPDGETTFLTIHDNLYHEWVHAINECGTVYLERGIGGSEPRKFPKGSCVEFELSVPVVKWLICNYDCCADGDCDHTPVTLERAVLPTGIVNMPWEGRLIYNGSMPIDFSADGLPAWMSARFEGNIVELSGTPTTRGSFVISVSAVNNQGINHIVGQHKVTVTAAKA